jgi:hypothetical protein
MNNQFVDFKTSFREYGRCKDQKLRYYSQKNLPKGVISGWQFPRRQERRRNDRTF